MVSKSILKNFVLIFLATTGLNTPLLKSLAPTLVKQFLQAHDVTHIGLHDEGERLLVNSTLIHAISSYGAGVS